MKSSKTARALPPPRVRREPPTLAEAIVAAQGMTDDVEQQVAFAAGLMGVAEDEVRSEVVEAPPPPPVPMVRTRETPGRTLSVGRPAGVVVVERRSRPMVGAPRTVIDLRRPMRG